MIVGDRELPKILEPGLPMGLDYYSEFIEQARFAETDYQRAFLDFLKLKYADHQLRRGVGDGGHPAGVSRKYRATRCSATRRSYISQPAARPL